MRSNKVDVNVKMVMRDVPYKKRKLAQQLENFCAGMAKKFTQLKKEIGNKDSSIHTGYWVEGPGIEKDRKIYFDRTGQHELHIDWSEVNKEYIRHSMYYHSDGKWYDIISYIKLLFSESWIEEGLKHPKVKIEEDHAVVSFYNQKSRDAIMWYEMPDIVHMDMGGAYQMGESEFASELLHFADSCFFLEVSMTKEECIGYHNLSFLNAEEFGIRCGNKGIYKSDKGYYLCQRCGSEFLDMIGRIRKLR